MKYSLSKEQNKKQTKYKNDFNNVKSNFILKKIFDLMKKNKTLKIIKYNKKLHNRLKLEIFNSFNDEHSSKMLLISIILELLNFLK